MIYCYSYVPLPFGKDLMQIDPSLPMQTWFDNRLKWDPRQYGNVSTVHLAPDGIWKPDVKAFNSIEHEFYSQTDMVVYSVGKVRTETEDS